MPGRLRCRLHGSAGGRPRRIPLRPRENAALQGARARWVERMRLAKARPHREIPQRPASRGFAAEIEGQNNCPRAGDPRGDQDGEEPARKFAALRSPEDGEELQKIAGLSRDIEKSRAEASRTSSCVSRIATGALQILEGQGRAF